MLHSLRGAARCRRGAATAARCGLPQVGRQDVDLPPTARHHATHTFAAAGERVRRLGARGRMRGGNARASRRGGSLGHSSFDLGDQMECKSLDSLWVACGGARPGPRLRRRRRER